MKARRLLRAALLLILLALALYLFLQKSLSQVILNTAHASAYALAVDTLNAAVRESVADGVPYEQLVSVRTDSAGRVTMLQANTARMNTLAAEIARTAQRALAEDAARQISVPLGAALKVPFLSSAGPRVRVRLTPVGAVNVSFHTEFENAGINQTRHKIYLQLHASVELVLPTGSRPVAADTQVLIAESIIVGDVPQSSISVPESEMLNFGDVGQGRFPARKALNGASFLGAPDLCSRL